MGNDGDSVSITEALLLKALVDIRKLRQEAKQNGEEHKLDSWIQQYLNAVLMADEMAYHALVAMLENEEI